MCGILTYYNKNGISKMNLTEALSALNVIKHRGPDGDSVVLINTKTGNSRLLKTSDTPADITTHLTFDEYSDYSADLFLGHRRLSIFDVSSNGFQPMRDETGNWIVFNGAVYNFVEIRYALSSKGYKFRTKTDTEVILAAYQEWKEQCLNQFNGIWAFVIWDNLKKKLFISNDRFGVKPLYYLQNLHELILCSEQKQLLQFKNRVKGYKYDNIKIFIESGIIDHDASTFFLNVFRFHSSNHASLDLLKTCENNISIGEQEHPYYHLPTGVKNYGNEQAALSAFSELLGDAVNLRLRADVPWGITVSGGLDSSAIVYTAHDLLKQKGHGGKINAFSAVFPGMQGDESPFIRFIEKDLSLNANYVNPVEKFSFDDFEKHLFHQDVPIQSTSYYAEWCVARMAKEKGIKILINGQGGDEIFAGYHHHFYRFCRTNIMKGKIIDYLRMAKAYAAQKEKSINEIHRIVLNDVILLIKLRLGLAKLSNKLVEKWSNASTLTDLLSIDFNEQALPTYLRSDDRDGMAFGIESRHPFLDYRLVEFGWLLPDKLKIKNGWQKYIIRNALINIPDEIRFRKDKKGFTTPQDMWIEKNKHQFEVYLQELDALPIKINDLPADKFRLYALGGWLKHYKVVTAQ